MQKIIRGKAFVFGANIDTDQIYPGRYLELTDPEVMATHAMEGADPNFAREFQPGDIIVAATNFGCGSSREHAAVALKTLGVAAILAESFGRIFYRNGINLGIPLVVCTGISKQVEKGDTLRINLTKGEVENETSGEKAKAEPLSDYVMTILESGGIKELIRKQTMQALRALNDAKTNQ